VDQNPSGSEAYDHISVVGAGAWGTALAAVAAQAGRRVTLWAREPEVVQSIRNERRNTMFLPGMELPATIEATDDLASAASADAILLGAPAQHLRSSLTQLVPLLQTPKPLVVCAKGIERGTGKLMTEVLGEFVRAADIAILSGPAFARDVTNNLPTAVTIAAADLTVAQALQVSLSHSGFRPYGSDDVIGVALGGAAKNVYAIACGILAGMGLGESARAALLARSFAELRRLGEALGAKSETLMGLSGLGDLVLTATSPTSRNYALGLAIGKGSTRAELDARGHPLAEGAETAPALVARAVRHGVELPIAETTAAILDGSLALNEAILRLMMRPLKSE
jgi:glycerol-3-phosphate dehydrogenase (NAD(P)+)